MNLETDRLRIRPFAAADFEDYFAYILEPELQHMLGLNGVQDRQSALNNFSWLLENREFLALEWKESSRVIGHICLHPPLEGLETGGRTGKSLSFAVAAPYRRKGVMSEALKELIRQLRSTGAADFLDLEYIPENAGSARLGSRLGFTVVGEEQFDSVRLIVSVLPLSDRGRE